MKTKLIKYGLILLVLFLAYQQIQIYIDGIAGSPLVTAFRYDAPLKKLREMKLKKGEERQTVPGNVQVIVPKNVNAAEEIAKDPERQFTIGRWTFEEACVKGGVLEVLWQPSTGKATLTYDAPPTRTFELGRLREVGLWAGVGYSSEGFKTPLIALEARMDLFRVGPSWVALRAGLQWRKIQDPISGYEKSDTVAYAAVGFPIVRW